MYIKVYNFGMEMSQRIHFWYQHLPILPLKIYNILEKMTKNHFLEKKFLDSLENTILS